MNLKIKVTSTEKSLTNNKIKQKEISTDKLR